MPNISVPTGRPSDEYLQALLEAYLLVATEPIRVDDVSKTLDLPSSLIRGTFDDLTRLYGSRTSSGLRISRLAGGYQMTTRDDLSIDVAKLLSLPKDKAKLSTPALETVAVIAYQQPATIAEVEAIRGVSADGVIKTLLDRRLIQEYGRKQIAGRPILYVTTPEFLHYFGLDTLQDLPPLEEIEIRDEQEAEVQVLVAVGLVDE